MQLLLFLFSPFLTKSMIFFPTEKVSGVSITSTNLPIEGKPVNLTCEAAGSVPTRKWMKDGSDFNLADNITLHDENRVLSFHSLKKSDKGKYSCKVSNPVNSEEATFNMVVNLSIPTIACPTENLIEGKTSVNLTCDADGFVSTRVWVKDGQPLVPGERYSFHDGNRVLSISPVNRTDTGEFLCKVSNDFSSATAKCALKVYYGPDKPRIVQTPIGAELEESVTLYCSADSLPKATFFWTFKHMKMYGAMHYIHEMEERHLGRYTCTAQNAITGLEASVFHTLRGI
uniref:Ig-like domain-containing protein n=1 Tax=Dicentrarchus labrax TaxID=13489 RepID=A0A8P4GEP4_DICLA